MPVMRPLEYHYPVGLAGSTADEYLLGRDILVAPVLEEGAEERIVFLPDDIWLHLFTGEWYNGGRYTVRCPLGTPPVFIRKGSSYVESLREAMVKI